MKIKEKVMNDFIAEIAALKQQRDELQRDAERYRWLREMPNADLLEIYCCGFDLDGICDAAIDAAIAKVQK